MNATKHDDLKLIVYNFEDSVNEETAGQILNFLSSNVETMHYTKRFLDLSNVAHLDMDYSKIDRFVKKHTRLIDHSLDIKTAFVTKSALAKGMVNMFINLHGYKKYECMNFNNHQDAANWLEVDPKLLGG